MPDPDDHTEPSLLEPDEARGILNSLLADLPGVIYRCRNDDRWTMLGITANVEELTGHPPADLLLNAEFSWSDLIHPDDGEEVRQIIEDSVDSDTPFRVTYRIRTRWDEERWVLEQGRAVEDENEDERILTGYIQDISGPFVHRISETENRLEKIRSELQALDLLQEITAIANQEQTLDRALSAAVPEICRTLELPLGYGMASGGESEGTRSSGIWHMQKEVEGLDEGFRSALEEPGVNGQEDLVGRILKTGEMRWIEDPGTAPDFARMDPAYLDALRACVAVPVLSGDRPVGVLAFFSVQEMSRNPELEEVLEQVGVQLGRVWERGEAREQLGDTTRLLRRTREEAEARLRESEERFRQIAEHIDAVFWITTPEEGRIQYVSPAYRTVMGDPPEELYEDASRWLEHIHPEDRERVRDVLPDQRKGTYDEEYRIIRADGEIRWIWDRAFPVENETGEVYRIIGVATDITEQRALGEQLRQSQKLEGVGRLAGGIAHDFNNLLTVIRGQSDLLHMDLEPGSPLLEEVQVIRESADRAADLTSKLLAFSRDQVLQPRILDLNRIIKGMDELLDRVLGDDLHIETHLADALPPIRIDPGQMEHVLMNLAMNARDAMPEGGTLRFSTSVESMEPEEASAHPEFETETAVRLDVSDTGIGMDEQTRQRVFDPFFTTKEKAGGTGLGLAMVYGTVQQSGGSIRVESEPGRGTVFTLRFPPASGTAEEPEPRIREGLESYDLSGRVLVVEDDPDVRAVAFRILARGGLEIRMAEDAETALEILEEPGARIDLIVTDLVLPGMSGRKLVDQISERWPTLPIVVMSGYAEGSPGSRMDLPAEIAFIQKPFTPVALLRTVGGELEGPPPAPSRNRSPDQ